MHNENPNPEDDVLVPLDEDDDGLQDDLDELPDEEWQEATSGEKHDDDGATVV
jgi:hypothetical protein